MTEREQIKKKIQELSEKIRYHDLTRDLLTKDQKMLIKKLDTLNIPDLFEQDEK